MPTYDYECEKCTKVSTVTHRMSEVLKLVCDKCSTPLVKLVSAPVVLIKHSDKAAP